MKKLICLALALCLLVSLLCGCGKGKKNKDTSSKNDPSSAVSSVATAPPVTPPPVQKAKAVKINADPGLNIRSGPSTDSEILGMADDGSMLALLVEKATDGWYQVSYAGKTAYVSAEFAKVQEVTLDQYNELKKAGTDEEGSSSSGTSSSASSKAPAAASTASSSSSSDAGTSQSSGGDSEDGE